MSIYYQHVANSKNKWSVLSALWNSSRTTKNDSGTNQGKCHAHDHRDEDEVEGGNLKYIAVRVRVFVDIFILPGHAQGHGTTILSVYLL